MNPLFNLKGRTALVTGSSRGIGRAIALELARAGADLLVHGTRPGESLDSAAAEIGATGSKAVALTGDLGDAGETEQLIRACRETAGAPDIVVLNASVQSYMPLEAFAPGEFEREFAVNVRSAFQLVRAFLPEMKAKGWGRLLSIGSVNQWMPSPRLPVYAATKAALANFMLGCARAYAGHGITANNIAPGVIVTGRNREALADAAFRARALEGIPAGRFGTPGDCAGLALLLCSDAGAYITGTDIAVDGGMRL